MIAKVPPYTTRLAQTHNDVDAAFSLRYRVFGSELGGQGASVDQVTLRESDEFDPVADHLLLTETDSGAVIGTYRLIDQAAAKTTGRFYTEGEFDLTGLKASGQSLLEVGRTCLDPNHRGGAAMLYLWAGLVAEVRRRKVDWVFGSGSFAGTDAAVLAPLIRLLEERFGAPAAIAPRVNLSGAMDTSAATVPDDPAKAMSMVPPLIKSYLRAGGRIGQGAYVDRALNLTDVCIVLETASAIWPPDPEARG